MKGMTVKFAFAMGEEVVDESPLANRTVSPYGKRGKIVGATFTAKGIFYSIEGRQDRRFQAKEEALTSGVDFDKAQNIKMNAAQHDTPEPELA